MWCFSDKFQFESYFSLVESLTHICSLDDIMVTRYYNNGDLETKWCNGRGLHGLTSTMLVQMEY